MLLQKQECFWAIAAVSVDCYWAGRRIKLGDGFGRADTFGRVENGWWADGFEFSR